ncbi:MAG: Maf family nucleotide pyrophosphatase [Cytophagales bacterium]|nr:Maf family nucleotide pyrophosphatase [Cytophagales bacterium]
MKQPERPLILASTSPRRQFLMKEAGYQFRVEAPDSEELFPDFMPAEMVPRYLAEEKAKPFKPRITNEIVITADTVVIQGGRILNKPANRAEAIQMLSMLAGKTHKVITAVCLMASEKQELFGDSTQVTFAKLTEEEIAYYVDTYKPFDKAGAYGAQDWIGMVGIERINGSYFTVMGMPMHKVYTHLRDF